MFAWDIKMQEKENNNSNLFKMDESVDHVAEQPVDIPVVHSEDKLVDPPVSILQLNEPDEPIDEPPMEPIAEPETAPVIAKTYGPYPKKMYHRFGLSSRLVGSKQEEINMGSEWGDKPFPNEYAIIEEKIPSHRFI